MVKMVNFMYFLPQLKKKQKQKQGLKVASGLQVLLCGLRAKARLEGGLAVPGMQMRSWRGSSGKGRAGLPEGQRPGGCSVPRSAWHGQRSPPLAAPRACREVEVSLLPFLECIHL